MSTETRVAALQNLLARVLVNAKLPRAWLAKGDASFGGSNDALILDPLTEEPSTHGNGRLALDSEPPQHALDASDAAGPSQGAHASHAADPSYEADRAHVVEGAQLATPVAPPPSGRGARPPTPAPPALTQSDSSPLHDAVISHTETTPGGGLLENGFGLVPPPPRVYFPPPELADAERDGGAGAGDPRDDDRGFSSDEPTRAMPDFVDEPTSTGDPDEAEELLLAEQEAADRQRVRFPTPPPGSAVGLRPYSPDTHAIPTPPMTAPASSREPIRPPSPEPFPASARLTPPPPAWRGAPPPQPSRPVLELDLDLETPSTDEHPGGAELDAAESRGNLDFERTGFSDDGIKTDPPPPSIGRAERSAHYAPDGVPSLPDLAAIEEHAMDEHALGDRGVPSDVVDIGDHAVLDDDDESPSSSRQVRAEVRPVDERFGDFGPVGDSEPPPESGEVPSQSHPQVAVTHEDARGEVSGEYASPQVEGEDEDERDEDDRRFAAPVDYDATAEVRSLGRVDVVEQTAHAADIKIISVSGARPTETFGGVVDASLALKWSRGRRL